MMELSSQEDESRMPGLYDIGREAHQLLLPLKPIMIKAGKVKGKLVQRLGAPVIEQVNKISLDTLFFEY